MSLFKLCGKLARVIDTEVSKPKRLICTVIPDKPPVLNLLHQAPSRAPGTHSTEGHQHWEPALTGSCRTG